MTERQSIDIPGLPDVKAAAILNSLPDGVYITDSDRRILFWNKEAERMTGWLAGDVLGHRCHENILCHVDKDGHLLCGHEYCPLHRAMVTGIRSELPHLIFAQRRDGHRIPVEVSVAPIRNDVGEVVGGIEVFRDLSPAFVDLNRARIIQSESVGIQTTSDDRLSLDVRYTPHDQVGGDFYRAERIGPDTYAILMADVVGHGVSAALYTMQLRSMWEEGRGLLDNPAGFLGWLSRRVEILRDTDHGYFATAAHVTYRADTGELTCAIAGHPPPVVIRADGSLDQLNATGPALGLLPEPVFKNAHRTLHPGDHLIMFTDGAFEVINAAGHELDEKPFLRLVQQADLSHGADSLNKIEESLLHYTNALSLPDDLTLIHLMRK